MVNKMKGLESPGVLVQWRVQNGTAHKSIVVDGAFGDQAAAVKEVLFVASHQLQCLPPFSLWEFDQP